MDDVVPPSVAEEVPEDAEAEHERGQRPPPALAVELHRGPDSKDVHAGNAG